MGLIFKFIYIKVNIKIWIFKYIFYDFCGVVIIVLEEKKIYYMKFKNDLYEIFFF